MSLKQRKKKTTEEIRNRKRLTSKKLKVSCEKKEYKKKYFGQEEEDWIVKFIACKGKKKRNSIFVKRIYPAFQELINNLVNVYQMGNVGRVDLIKKEALSHLFIKLCAGNFDNKTGAKAFSYFNVIARNFMFQKYKDNKQYNEKVSQEDYKIHAEELKQSTNYKILRDIDPSKTIEDTYIKKECVGEFINVLQKFKGEIGIKLKEEGKVKPDNICGVNEKYCKIVDAVCELFKQADSLPSLKKKTIYFFIKEITGLDAKDITDTFKLLTASYPNQLSLAFQL